MLRPAFTTAQRMVNDDLFDILVRNIIIFPAIPGTTDDQKLNLRHTLRKKKIASAVLKSRNDVMPNKYVGTARSSKTFCYISKARPCVSDRLREWR